MKTSRSQKAIANTLAGFLNEFVTLICGLILPRLILLTFGSAYNGITASISQFLSCIALMKSGIGGVTRAALYKPLAEKNTEQISAIILQTERFMRRVALIFVAFVAVFACIYPIWISTEFPWLFTASLILILASSTFLQYFFGLTYQMLLNADQRQCVSSFVGIGTTVLNTVVAVALIYMGGSIHVVKLGSALVYALNPLIISVYVKRKYKINRKVKPKVDLIKQRWDAMGHEVANFVNSNTDVMTLTVFAGLNEVSVYTVYISVIAGIRAVIANFITGFGAAFGNMHAKKQMDLMHNNLGIYELIVFSLSSVIHTTTLIMIVPFAALYTAGVNDVNYMRPLFGILITVAAAFSCYRIPYQTIVTAVGHYKQTRNGAFFEAAMNVVLSVIGVLFFGLVGVAVGTLAAAVFRTCQYAIYLGKHVLPRSPMHFIKHILLALTIMGVTYLISTLYISVSYIGVGGWIAAATITTMIALFLTLVTDWLLYRETLKCLLAKLRGVIKTKGA